MHVIPDLKKLEEKFGSELQVIGIHSGKFSNERDSAQIESAVERFGIKHPVVNDLDYEIWKSYLVRAWPTVVLIDQEGKIVLSRSGEGVFSAFDPEISKLIEAPKAAVKKNDEPALLSTDLRFPGKILGDENGDKIFISDSGRNRVLIVSTEGELLDTIGSGEAGASDGTFESSSFRTPQGLALVGDILYVADEANNSIRSCDLKSRTVTTRIRSSDESILNSPWDLVNLNADLYVAMAGAHQIWKADLKTGIAKPYSGNGREDIKDGNRLEASHAQPSGITSDGKNLYVADSETSSIRVVSLASDGSVSTLVGEGLFEFGDRDGIFKNARLQHPLGVAILKGGLFVADTFNSKIKKFDLQVGAVQTIPISMKLNEPGGISSLNGMLLIADTNNHRVIKLDPVSGKSEIIQIHESVLGDYRELEEIEVKASSGVVKIEFVLPAGYEFNNDAPNRIEFEKDGLSLENIIPSDGVQIPMNSEKARIKGEIFFCESSSKRCLFDRFKIDLKKDAESKNEKAVIRLKP